MLGRLIMIGAALTAAPAFANDSVAERGAGGLILSRTDAVSMLSENLSISRDQGRCRLCLPQRDRCRCRDGRRLPDARYQRQPQRDDRSAGRPVRQFPRLPGVVRRQRREAAARAEGVRASASTSPTCSSSNNVPFNPFLPTRAKKALEGLPEATAADWITRGLISRLQL